MAEKKKYSETLEQRKKAQREFLELKKMQQGAIEAPLKPSEEAIEPKTFGEKVANFWFHYKVHMIFIVFFAVVIAFGVAQCLGRETYDARVVMYTQDYYTDTQMDVISDYLTPYFTDVDRDGEVEVQVINCSYNDEDTYDFDYVQSLATKLQAVIANEGDVQLFIVDEVKKQQLNSISNEGLEFFVDEAALPDDFYEAVKSGDFEVPENLIIGRRIVSGTLIENKKNIDTYVSQAESVLEQIKAK